MYLFHIFICLVLNLLCFQFIEVKSETLNDTRTLFTTLFETNGYNKKIRPLEDQADILDITITFYLSAITDFDEQEESLTTAGYLSLTWQDASLIWEPNDYNGTVRLFIPQDDVWKPDISLRNTYSNFKGLGSPHFNIWVLHNGSIVWEPFQVLKSTCHVDITYFPYDTQTCELHFIAWSYTQSEINFFSAYEVQTTAYSESSTWKLVKSSALSENSYGASITFALSLQRKPLFYVLNIILPVILLSMLNIVTFVLPIKSGERASYSVTVFLSLAVFLTIVASEVPKNSDQLSVLAVYLVFMLNQSTFFVIVSVIELRVMNRDGDEPVDTCFRGLHNFVQTLRCRRTKCRQRKVSNSKTSIEKLDTQEDVTWCDIVDAMDFILFWLGILTTVLSTVIVMALLWINY